MRRYEREECGLSDDEGVAYIWKNFPEDIKRTKVVWRKAEYDGEEEFNTMWSWNENNIKGNPRAVDAFLVRLG